MKVRLGLAVYAGGNHVFYIAGLLKYLLEQGLRFDVISTYSSGGALLPFVQSNKLQKALKIFQGLTVRNKKNIYLGNLLSDQSVFPHDAIYHEAVKQAVREFSSFSDDKREFRLIVSKFKAPDILAPGVAFGSLIFLLLYAVTRKVTGSWFVEAYKYIFRIQPEVIDLKAIRDKAELVTAIIGSSTVFPFIKLRKRQGYFMLDGKLSMLTPIGELGDCSHVLSLHAHHTFAPRRENLIQIFPKRPVENGPFDYAGYESFTLAFEQGYAEGPHQLALAADTPFFNP